VDTLIPEDRHVRTLHNIALTQQVPAVRATADALGRELISLKWGLIPSWSNDPKIANSLINARAEMVAEKPAFRPAFKKRRCLILADGYYELTGKPGKKQPGGVAFGSLLQILQGGIGKGATSFNAAGTNSGGIRARVVYKYDLSPYAARRS
jgi:putative SOS response-associated peptidase YedK